LSNFISYEENNVLWLKPLKLFLISHIIQSVSVARWPVLSSSINVWKISFCASSYSYWELSVFSLSFHCLFVTPSLCLVTFVVSLPLHLSVLLAHKALLYLANCLSHQLILLLYIFCLFVVLSAFFSTMSLVFLCIFCYNADQRNCGIYNLVNNKMSIIWHLIDFIKIFE